jgi:tetratricopeptide (TPR) repeat protein
VYYCVTIGLHESAVVAMPAVHEERYDFFLSRRGSVAAVAREVADVLTGKGYKVLVQDYDIPLGASFVEAMHEAVKNSRDLVILFTRDYEQSPYTRKEFTSFEAERAQSTEERHVIVLRCEDVPLRGLLADNVYQDLVGVEDPEDRKRRIIAAAERQSQAAAPPPRPFIGVPPRIATFTGRAEELDLLDAILMRDKPAAVTQAVGRAAVQGLGGVGKTSLATEYAHRYRQLYAGVCWCSADTRSGLLTGIAGLAMIVGAATAAGADVETVAKAALRRLSEHRATWLLVYDNVTSPDEIADVLPSEGARVLITSRFSDWSALADEVSLDVLPIAQAVAFLQTRSGRDEAGAQALAEELGCLPLALDHAAAYCKRAQMRFADYAAKASSLIATAPRGVGYPRSIVATFDLAINHAVEQCAACDELIAYLAQCAPEHISEKLLEGAVEQEELRHRALSVLIEMSLIRSDLFADGTLAVTVHRLVQTVARKRSLEKGMAQAAIQRLISRLLLVFPSEEDAYVSPQFWPICATLVPHVLALSAMTDEVPSKLDLADLLSRTGRYFDGRGSYTEAEQVLRKALAIREAALAGNHPKTADTLSYLASVLQEQGDLRQAISLLRRAIAIYETVYGQEHAETATALSNLGTVYQDLGEFEAARPLYERAMKIRETVIGADHAATATSLNNLATLLTLQKKFAAAQPLLERALAIRSRVYGPEHPRTGQAMSNLALALEGQGDLAGSRTLKERALTIREKTLGNEHPDTAESVNNLGRLLEAQGEIAEARRCYERAVAILERVLSPDHPNTNVPRLNLARVMLHNGDLLAAHAQARIALDAHARTLGPDHPWTKDSARVSADALDALARTDEAAVLRERHGITSAQQPDAGAERKADFLRAWAPSRALLVHMQPPIHRSCTTGSAYIRQARCGFVLPRAFTKSERSASLA